MKNFLTVLCLILTTGAFATSLPDQDIEAEMVFSNEKASWIAFSSPLYKDVDPAQKTFEALKAMSTSKVKYYKLNGEREISQNEYRDYVDTIEVTNGLVNCHYIHHTYYCRIWL